MSSASELPTHTMIHTHRFKKFTARDDVLKGRVQKSHLGVNFLIILCRGFLICQTGYVYLPQ